MACVAIEIDVRAVRPLARLVGAGVDEWRRIRVADLHLRRVRSEAAGDAPDLPIAVAGHVIEHLDLALEHLVVGRQHVFLVLHARWVDVARVALDEGQEGAIAEGGEGVGGAIALEPLEALVGDGALQRRQVVARVGSRRRAEQIAVDDLGQAAVAFFVEVHAVGGQRGLHRGVERPRRREEIDEAHAAGRRHLRHRQGVHLEAGVVRLAVGQIRIAEIFVRDRREQHDARRGLAVVLLRQRVRDPVVELLPEGRQAGVSPVRLVVAEEREDHVRLGVGALETVLLVAADLLADAAQPLIRANRSSSSGDGSPLRRPRTRGCG